MHVSVIVPAHDRVDQLAECLEALRASDFPDFSITVVDDGSREDVASVAAAWGAPCVRLERNSGVGPARNLGARESQGAILFFVDSDLVVQPDTVARVARFFEREPGIAAVFGSYDSAPRATQWVSQFRNLLHHWTHQIGDPEAATYFGALGAIRRSVFDEVGGFAEGYFGRVMEDIELGYRLRDAGHRIRLDKDLQATHLKRWTLGSMIRTDFARRAVPWARLLRARPSVPRGLNIRRGQQASVVLVGLGTALALASPWWPRLGLLAGAAALGVWVLNWPLYGFLRRERGLAFALTCLPLHWIYFLCAGAGFAWARLTGQRGDGREEA